MMCLIDDTNVCSVLHHAKDVLKKKSLSPALDAEILLAHVLKVERLHLLTNCKQNLTEREIQSYFDLVTRREQREPVAYLIGKKEFFGRDFKVNHNVLVPRPETEELVEEALKLCGDLDFRKPIHILDLGTGSGCIAITLVKELEKEGKAVNVVAVDISAKALEVAQENAHKHNVHDFISFKCGNWFSSLSDKQKFDLIISNPPYASESDIVAPEVLFEPHEAIFSKDLGLHDIKLILESVAGYLHNPGVFLCEIGAAQGQFVAKMCLEILSLKNMRFEILCDLSSRERMLKIVKNQ